MKYKDIILVDADDFKKAVEVLEEAGIEVSRLNTRYVP